MNCELRIERDTEGGVLRPGDQLVGKVIVRTDTALEAARIRVHARLQTGSANFFIQRTASAQDIRVGPIEAGEHMFELRGDVPSYPPNYEGAHIGWTWQLEGKLDVGGVEVASDTMDLDVRAPAGARWQLVPSIQGDPARVDPRTPDRNPALAALLGAILLGSLGLLTWEIYDATAGDGDGSLVGLACMLSIASAVGYFKVRGRMEARQRLGTPQLVVEHDLDAETLRCSLWTRPPGPTGEVRAHLAAREETIVGDPTRDGGKKEIRFVLWEASTELTQTQTGCHTGTLPVSPSETLPPLVDDHDRGLAWRLWITVFDEYGRELTKIERRLDAAIDSD